jgi:hypothetical protein
MEATGTIASRIIQYLGIKGVTQEEFAEDVEYGKSFDKGRLGKAKTNYASIGSDVVEKFLRRFPDVNPYWLILGQGSVENEKRVPYTEPVKTMPVDVWEELKFNNREFAATRAADTREKGQLLEAVLNFSRSSIVPHK